MKVGKLNSRISRVGQKIKQDIGSAVGKTQKVIRQGERGLVKGLGEVQRAADSKIARGIQQGAFIAGRALAATGVPEAQALGVGLTGIGTSIKETRASLPDKLGKMKRDVSRSSNQLQGRVAAEGAAASRQTGRGVRLATGITGNELERAPPMSETQKNFAELPQYVD